MLLFGPALVQAPEPENYIKYRDAIMQAVGEHMAAASHIVPGKVAPEGDLPIHAKSLKELSRQITRRFPAGSDFGETQAKAEIWDERQKFEQAAIDAKRISPWPSSAALRGTAAPSSPSFPTHLTAR